MSVLRVRNLRLRRGTRDILAGVDFDAARGEIVVLMGLGKSTVLRAIAGLERLDAGEIHVNTVEVTAGRQATARVPLRPKIGIVFQVPSLFEHMSAIDNVCLAPRYVLRLSRAEAMARARELLEQLGVAERADALPRELSGGDARRVAIARSLAMDPALLMLDEPMASLDPARRTELGQILLVLAASGRTLVLTSNDEDLVRRLASRVVILADGRVVEAGEPGKVLAAPLHPATRALLQPQPPLP